MKNKNIRKITNKLKRKLKYDITIESVIDYLKKSGYLVVFFNNPQGDKLIKEYKLEEYADTKQAFTCRKNNMQVVFVDDVLSHQDKLYALLHELGHIVFEHLDGLVYSDNSFCEIEAETFAYEMLKPRKHTALIIFTVFVITSLVLGIGCILYTKENNSMQNNVAVTRTGQSYHRESCMSIQGKDYIYIPKTEAEKIYSSCGICNPQ